MTVRFKSNLAFELILTLVAWMGFLENVGYFGFAQRLVIWGNFACKAYDLLIDTIMGHFYIINDCTDTVFVMII